MSFLGRVADAGVGCESCSSLTSWGHHLAAPASLACNNGAFGRAAPKQLATYRRQQHPATALRGLCPLASAASSAAAGSGGASSSTRCNAVLASAPATSLAGLRQEAYMQASLGPGSINPPTRVKAPGRIVASKWGEPAGCARGLGARALLQRCKGVCVARVCCTAELASPLLIAAGWWRAWASRPRYPTRNCGDSQPAPQLVCGLPGQPWSALTTAPYPPVGTRSRRPAR